MKQNDSIGEYVNIETLQENPKNPRANELAVDKIARSIERFGFAAPIVARKSNGMIIAGHTRYKAAKKLRLQNVPVRWVDLNQTDSELYMIADNKLGELATWDYAILQDMINQNLENGIDLSDVGFTEQELKAFSFDNDDLNNADAEWVDMPEFINDDLTSKRKIIVHFENDTDVNKFANLVKQKITDRTKFIWYPFKEQNDFESKRY